MTAVYSRAVFGEGAVLCLFCGLPCSERLAGAGVGISGYKMWTEPVVTDRVPCFNGAA
jgi:hypothetical protein